MAGLRDTSIAALAAAACASALASAAGASAPPVGTLPAGPTSRISTSVGELVAVALPHRPNGRVWRVARAYDAKVVKEVSEADVGSNVILVFRASGKGTTTIAFGLTRGERTKAYEARSFTVQVG